MSNKSTELKSRVESAVSKPIALSDLILDAEQPRTRIEQLKIESLAGSIKDNGMLHDIIVRDLNGKLLVVCGERRVRAHQFLGKNEINGKILILTDDEVTELQLVENSQREDMSPMDYAKAFLKYHTKGVINSEISRRFGKSADFVREHLLFNRLIPELQEAIDLGELRNDVAVEVAQLGADTQQAIVGELFEIVPIKLLKKVEEVEEDFDNGEYEDDEFADDEENEDFEGENLEDENLEEVAETVETEPVVQTTNEVLTQRKSVSLGKVQKLISERVLVDLTNAPFDHDDARLHPNGLLCTGCPNRNGNDTLFDLGSDNPNICLDPICYQGKGKMLVQITRTENVSATGDETLAKTITNTYYGNSPYRLEDTLPNNSFKRIGKKDEEIDVEDNCENSEFAISTDISEVGQVYLICANKDCEKHFPKYSYSSTTEEKPELSDAERSLKYQESRQKGLTGKAVEIARPDFYRNANRDYNALRWIFNDEDLRLMMIIRFCELIIKENADDFVFACEVSDIKVCKINWQTTQEEKDEAEIWSGYWGAKDRTFLEDIKKIDEDRISKLLFTLTFVKNGRDFKNMPIEADAEMHQVAEVLGAEYELFYAERQVEVADKQRKPFAEKYFADLKAGIANERPNLFTECANEKNGTKAKPGKEAVETESTAEESVTIPKVVETVEVAETVEMTEAVEISDNETTEQAENTVFAQAK